MHIYIVVPYIIEYVSQSQLLISPRWLPSRYSDSGVTKRLHQQIPCVVMEYLPLGSLYDYLKGRDGEYLPTTAVLALAHQLAEGMIYLESKGIVHRDLASRNCLLGPPTPDSHGVPILKVSDFGMSRILENVQVIVQSTDNKVQVMNPYLSMTTSMTTNSLGVLGESDPKTLSNRAGSSKRYKSKEYKKETYNQILRVGCTGNEGSDLLRQSSGDVVADFEGMGAFIPVPTPTGLYAQPASTHPQQHWGVSHGQHSMYSNSTSNTNNVSHTTIEKNRKSLRVAADTLMNNLVVVGDRILGIRRASWAPGQMEDRGVVEGSIHGPMPGQMHQNIQQSVMQPNNGQPFQQQLSYQRPPSYHQQQQQPYQGSPCYQEQPAYQESEQPQGQLQSYELHRQSLYNVPQQPRHQYMGRSSPVSQAGVDDEMGYLNINAKRLARGSKPVSQVGANEERGYINITAKHLAPEPLANKQKSSGPSYMGRNGGKVRLHQGPSTDALFMGVRESQAYTHSDEDTISSTEAITAARAMDVGAHTGEVSHTQTHSGVSPQVKPRPRPTSHGSSRGARRSSTASATHSISEQEEDGTSRSHTHMLGDHGTRSDEDGLGYASDAMRKSYASTPETGYKAHAHAHTHAHAHAHAHAHEDDEGYSEEGNEYMESGGDERANVPPITMAQMVGFKGHDLGMIDQATGECIDGTTCSGSVELLPNGRRPDSVISFNTCFPNFEDELKKEKGAYKDKEIFEVGDNAALPLRWMALESVQRHVFSTKSDVWSYGVVLWEIASLAALPYGPGDIHEILAKIETGYRLERPKHCPESLYDIMLSCWQEEPNDRPYFADIGENLSFTLGEIVRKRNLDNKSSGNRTGYISSCFDQDHLRSQYVMEAQAQAPAQAPAQRKQSQNLQQVASTGHYLQAAHLSMKPSESLSQAGPRVLHNVESSGNYLVATPNTPMVGDSDARAKFLYSFMEDETHSTPHVLGVGSNSSDTFHYYECGPVSNKNHRSSSMLYSNSNESGMGSSGTSLRGHQMSPRGPQLSPRVHTPPSAHMLSVERPHTYARPHIRGYDPDESPSSM
ncbi:TK protein kinase [Sphaeroforma arctica JP610]|uniref:TK protein kinase n=1 Tax=Sphaeroforma arctica JP610 TaxID=667725 RepID=A0A0L0FLR9_9EUKA|nr:TK protein kinase [Sphaeroforma arctica JP610]KNC77700.1 TK protein kinase [Sphaeroforma arctica JP610]|eukprot:XP_014151602.1 TK protein kinase [Sphaeroforma arctica JP610]